MSRRCLVTLPGAPEELIRCLPALEALATSGRRVVALAGSEVMPLVRLAPVELDLVPRVPVLAATRALVRTTDCGEAMILSGRLDDAWLARTADVGERWGYAAFLGGWFLTRRVRRPRRLAQRPACEDARELLEAMGAPLPAAPRPRLAVGPDLREAARGRLRRASVDGDGPLVGVYPGVRGGGGERPWPRRRFEELLRELRRRDPRTRAVLLATTEDLWSAVRVYEETGKIHPVIGPDLQLDVLAAFLGELDVMVAAESWLLDLAAAAGTRTVGLFIRDPRRWAPPGETHRTLRAGTLAAITVERVVDAVVTPGERPRHQDANRDARALPESPNRR